MRAWPNWIDKRDGARYELVLYANDHRNRTVYVLKSRDGGLNITSPGPGEKGSVIEPDLTRDTFDQESG